MADFSEVMVSNVAGAYHNPDSSTGCYWPPHMDTLPSTGVVVLVDVLLGGPASVEQTLQPNTPIPLTLADLKRAGGIRRYAGLTFHHVDRYTVDVWIGTAASGADRRTAERVLASIRPWTPPPPAPDFGQCEGGWQREAAPTGPLETRVTGIDATSSSDAWAVGSYSHVVQTPSSPSPSGLQGPPVASTPLALHWDGTAWHLALVPDPNLRTIGAYVTGGSSFRDVAAIAPDDVWAVGGGGNFGFTEHFDGTRWSVVESPRANLVNTTLVATDGTGPHDAWAVGSGGPGGEVGAVVEHWDGQRRALSALPDVGTRYTTADDVSASSPTDAWVVGQRWDQALALHWNGTSWRSVTTPEVRTPTLHSVVDLGPTDAWAVGTTYASVSGAGPSHAIIEHWDGTRWSLAALPALAAQSTLDAVSASGPSDVWALGWAGARSGQERTLLLHYDGSRWSLVSSPATSMEQGWYADVSATGGLVWLAGSEGSGVFYLPDRPFLARPC